MNPLIPPATAPANTQEPDPAVTAQPQPAIVPQAASPANTGLLTAGTLLNTGLGALQILATAIPQIGVPAEIAAEVVPLIEAAIAKLVQVKDSPVSFGQLESLRFTPRW